MTDQTAVPPAVELLRDFVNTREPQIDAEDLSTPAALGDWFAQRSLVPSGSRLGAADLEKAVTVREGLRAVLMTHAGHAEDADAIDALNRVLAAAPVALVLHGGGYRLSSTGSSPIAQAVGGLADAIRQSTDDQTWHRLKVCARDTCRWAFYDASRNQVRRWCSMAGCGNHVKMKRAYARRKQTG